MARSSVLLVLALAACGMPRATEAERVRDTLEILASARPGAFHGTLISERTREFASFGDLLEDAMAARVIHLGETHTNPAHHAFQARVIRALRGADPRLAIGLEMFSRPDQAALDDWIAGRIDEDEMLRRTEWSTRWGHDWSLYAPILRFARERRVPLVALNVRREITRKIGREGLASLTAEERAALPDLDLGNAEHRREVAAALTASHEMPRERLEHAYQAMVVWDEAMADAIVRWLESPPGLDRRLVVLVGSGHVRRRLGIPSRVARRGGGPQLTVVPVEIAADATDIDWRGIVTGDLGDYVLVTAPPPEGES